MHELIKAFAKKNWSREFFSKNFDYSNKSLNKIEDTIDKYVVIHRGHPSVLRTFNQVIRWWRADELAQGKFLSQVFESKALQYFYGGLMFI